jgi:hypothetical protein
MAAAPQPQAQALDRADRLAAIGAANDLAHQHRPRGPFATEAKTLEAAHDEQLLEIVGEGGEKGKEREPAIMTIKSRARPTLSAPPKAEITNALVANNPAWALVMCHTAINAGMAKV